MQHHPDRGGSEARFKEIQAAWEWIEAGKPVQEPAKPQPAYTSSFSDSKPKPPPRTAKAGNPAPGFAPYRGPNLMPRASGKTVTLNITQQQAFEGCTIPFIYQGRILYYVARPGSTEQTTREQFLLDETIGAIRPDSVFITVDLRIDRPVPPPTEEEKATAHRNTTLQLCALGLFTGGRFTVQDHLNQPVSVTIPAGYNPNKPVVVPGRGYGHGKHRGDLYITIEPVFKTPQSLSQNELKQLQRLNEMLNTFAGTKKTPC
jgi:curved DNA-binding protein CbpA